MMIWIITGLWILLGCAEGAHLIAIMTDRSLQTYTAWCSVFVLAGLLVYIVLVVWLGSRKKKMSRALGQKVDLAESGQDKSKTASQNHTWKRRLYIAVFAGLVTMTAYHFGAGYVPNLQDAVYEIVLGNVKSGTLMSLHPFLGIETTAAMPFRMKILGLSSFYSMLITISQQSAYMIMCKVVPLVLLGVSLLLYWCFAQKLFPRYAYKRWLFMCMIMSLYLITSQSPGLPGHGLFYAGFSGETIRSVLLMPYTVYVSWQRKWYLAALAGLAEACLVWTTFGIGYCFLIAVCMLGVHLWSDWRAKHAGRVE